MSWFSKVVGYEIKIRNSIACLYVSNEYVKIGIENTRTLIIAQKKCCDVNLTNRYRTCLLKTTQH